MHQGTRVPPRVCGVSISVGLHFSFAFALQGARLFGSACRFSVTAGWWPAQSLTPFTFLFWFASRSLLLLS